MGEEEHGLGQVVHLQAIAINGDIIYVSDARENGRVSKYYTSGNYISMWGSVGEGNGKFNEHHGIDFDSSQHVYVVDTCNARVQIFSPDGKFLGKWGSMRAANNQFIMPQDIAIDSEDNLYISDIGDAHTEVGGYKKLFRRKGSNYSCISRKIIIKTFSSGFNC